LRRGKESKLAGVSGGYRGETLWKNGLIWPGQIPLHANPLVPFRCVGSSMSDGIVALFGLLAIDFFTIRVAPS